MLLHAVSSFISWWIKMSLKGGVVAIGVAAIYIITTKYVNPYLQKIWNDYQIVIEKGKHEESLKPIGMPPSAYHHPDRSEYVSSEGLNWRMIRPSDVEEPPYCPCCNGFHTAHPTMIMIEDFPVPSGTPFIREYRNLTQVHCDKCHYEWYVYQKPTRTPYL